MSAKPWTSPTIPSSSSTRRDPDLRARGKPSWSRKRAILLFRRRNSACDQREKGKTFPLMQGAPMLPLAQAPYGSHHTWNGSTMQYFDSHAHIGLIFDDRSKAHRLPAGQGRGRRADHLHMQ
jgi:hypothetical protein